MPATRFNRLKAVRNSLSILVQTPFNGNTFFPTLWYVYSAICNTGRLDKANNDGIVKTLHFLRQCKHAELPPGKIEKTCGIQ